MKVVVLSDTHIRRGSKRRLPDQAYAALADAEAVVHAGDIVVADVLHELSGFAPVLAVLGNNDDGELAGMLPETLVHELAGVRVGVVHDSGPTQGRPARLRRRFPECELVIYGHSHIPYDGLGVEGQRLFNPGSPTERRSQPRATMGLLELADGGIRGHEIVAVD